MENVRVLVGTVVVGGGGIVDDNLVPCEFEADKVARVRQYGAGRDGKPTDTRWTEETLYATPEGQRIVHVNRFTAWQGEPCT